MTQRTVGSGMTDSRMRFLFSFSILSLAEPARAVLWLSNKEREKEKASHIVNEQ